jgi:hypothetical protein
MQSVRDVATAEPCETQMRKQTDMFNECLDTSSICPSVCIGVRARFVRASSNTCTSQHDARLAKLLDISRQHELDARQAAG